MNEYKKKIDEHTLQIALITQIQYRKLVLGTLVKNKQLLQLS